MESQLSTTVSLVVGNKLQFQLQEANGAIVSTATAKPSANANNIKIRDTSGAVVLKLKRGMIDRDLCAFNPAGQLEYRLQLPKILQGSLTRTFPLLDQHENIVGEFILGRALPKNSLLREKLEHFTDDDIIFKDDNGIIFYSYTPKSEIWDSEDSSLLTNILNVAKKFAHFAIAEKIGFIKGPSMQGDAFNIKRPHDTNYHHLMLSIIFVNIIIANLDE